MANIETTLPGGEVYSARAPNPGEWSRFIAHANEGNERVGFRELAQVCSTSHSPDEAVALLAKYPGAIRPLGEAIANLSKGDDDAETEGQTVLLADMVFRAPTLEEWEDFQAEISKPRADQHAIALATLAKLCDAPGKILARAEEHPGDVQEVMADITAIAGMQIKISVKKG